MPADTDEELMVRYQRGDLAAFDRLYMRYEQRIYGYLLRLVGDAERCAELFQEVFLRVHAHRRQYDGARPFAAWLFSIARNLAYNEIRQKKRRGTVVEIDGDGKGGPQSEEPDPQQVLEKEHLRQQVQRALQALPPEQREAILLSYYGGLKYGEIAAVVESSEDAIKQRVRRGMQKLRQQCRRLLED